MWLELNSCVKGDNTLFHWLVSHNHTSLSLDTLNPPIITNTVPVMCDATWARLPSGHWTDLITGLLILLQFWEDKDIMDSRNRKWCEQCTNTFLMCFFMLGTREASVYYNYFPWSDNVSDQHTY